MENIIISIASGFISYLLLSDATALDHVVSETSPTLDTGLVEDKNINLEIKNTASDEKVNLNFNE